MSKYRCIQSVAVTVTTQELIDAFPEEWKDAEKRGLDEEAFARESIAICDIETLVDLGSNVADDFEWEPV